MKTATAFLCVGILLPTGVSLAGGGQYTLTNLGIPENAYSAIGVRMNNLGHVAGWSQYFGQGEPSLRGWVWTPQDGFIMLDSPPDMFLGRFRAMDISDTGIVGGDGGFDIGLAWRLQDGIYTITGAAGGMPGAYLGGINNAGDLAGTAKDGTIVTPDVAWMDINGGVLVNMTPGSGGRATDINNSRQVSGYTQGSGTGFEAFRWTQTGGFEFLGTGGLTYSFGFAINDAGQVVGQISSATGNTTKPFIDTDGVGMQVIPAPVTQHTTANAVNDDGHVVGTADMSGGDLAWLWTGGSTVTDLNSLFDFSAHNINLLAAHDINDAGQILALGFDNNAVDWRMVILTPPTARIAGDVDADGIVGIEDFLALLGAWGPCAAPCPPSCAADFDDDCQVGIVDFLILLGNWS
jgi:probable HAF family extracellular repeat protein